MAALTLPQKVKNLYSGLVEPEPLNPVYYSMITLGLVGIVLAVAAWVW